MNTLTQQGENAIVVSAQDPGALCTALKQAMTAGIAVVTFDADTNPDCRKVFVSQASPEAIGRSEVQLLAKELNYTGDVAILSAAQTASNQNTWIQFMYTIGDQGVVLLGDPTVFNKDNIDQFNF